MFMNLDQQELHWYKRGVAVFLGCLVFIVVFRASHHCNSSTPHVLSYFRGSQNPQVFVVDLLDERTYTKYFDATYVPVTGRSTSSGKSSPSIGGERLADQRDDEDAVSVGLARLDDGRYRGVLPHNVLAPANTMLPSLLPATCSYILITKEAAKPVPPTWQVILFSESNFEGDYVSLSSISPAQDLSALTRLLPPSLQGIKSILIHAPWFCTSHPPEKKKGEGVLGALSAEEREIGGNVHKGTTAVDERHTVMTIFPSDIDVSRPVLSLHDGHNNTFAIASSMAELGGWSGKSKFISLDISTVKGNASKLGRASASASPTLDEHEGRNFLFVVNDMETLSAPSTIGFMQLAHHFLASGARNSVHIFTVVGCMDEQLFQELLQASSPPISASESEGTDEDFEWRDEEEEVKKRTGKEDLLPTTTRRIYKTLAQEMQAEKKRRPVNARLQLFCSSDSTLSSRHVYDFDLTTHLARHNFHSIFFDHSLAPSSARSSLVEQYADICREVAPLARLVLVCDHVLSESIRLAENMVSAFEHLPEIYVSVADADRGIGIVRREYDNFRLVDLVVVRTTPDKQRLTSLLRSAQIPVSVLHNGLVHQLHPEERGSPPPVSVPLSERKGIVIMYDHQNMHWRSRSTRLGLEWFFAQVAAKFSDTLWAQEKITLVGDRFGHPDQLLALFNPADIDYRILGHVSMAKSLPLLRRAKVIVVPNVCPTSTDFNLLTALSTGTPIITTSYATEAFQDLAALQGGMKSWYKDKFHQLFSSAVTIADDATAVLSALDSLLGNVEAWEEAHSSSMQLAHFYPNLGVESEELDALLTVLENLSPKPYRRPYPLMYSAEQMLHVSLKYTWFTQMENPVL